MNKNIFVKQTQVVVGGQGGPLMHVSLYFLIKSFCKNGKSPFPFLCDSEVRFTDSSEATT